jgi:hypothetical protein
MADAPVTDDAECREEAGVAAVRAVAAAGACNTMSGEP